MVTIWLIEDDETETEAGIRRLRAPVVFSHAGLAFTGLACWFVYPQVDAEQLAWAAAGTVVIAAVLGATMFTLWIGIRRIPSARAALRCRRSGTSRSASWCCPASSRSLPRP